VFDLAGRRRLLSRSPAGPVVEAISKLHRRGGPSHFSSDLPADGARLEKLGQSPAVLEPPASQLLRHLDRLGPQSRGRRSARAAASGTPRSSAGLSFVRCFQQDIFSQFGSARAPSSAHPAHRSRRRIIAANTAKIARSGSPGVAHDTATSREKCDKWLRSRYPFAHLLPHQVAGAREAKKWILRMVLSAPIFAGLCLP